MLTLTEINRISTAQNHIIGSASTDLRDIFRQFDLSQPYQARDGLLEVYPALTSQYGDLTATTAAEWYEDARRSQVGGSFNAQLAPSAPGERSEQTARWAASALFTASPDSTLDLLTGSMVRLLGDMSRDTITRNSAEDRAAVGWKRIARADGCDFCVMLSQRGAVYKRETATFASHDNCRCRAAPSWDTGAQEVDVMAYEASDRMESLRRRAEDPSLSATDRLRAQQSLDRHRARVNEWMDNNRWRLDDMRAELN